jgi:hypothetical protein
MAEQLRDVFGAIAAGSKLEIEGCIAALNPILCGLVLESVFEPGLFSPKNLPSYLENLFNALIAEADQRI